MVNLKEEQPFSPDLLRLRRPFRRGKVGGLFFGIAKRERSQQIWVMKKMVAVGLSLGVLLMAVSCFKMPKTSYTTVKAKVLKVYSATDAGHNYVAYVVDRSGTEVVINDAMGKSAHKVGDTIEYLDQKMDMAGHKSLMFTLLK